MYKKGESGNKEGRPVGSQNPANKLLRARFREVLTKYMQNPEDDKSAVSIYNDLKDIKPSERMNLIIKMANFVLPRLQAIEYTDPLPEWAEFALLPPDDRIKMIAELKKKLEK